jgi:ATP-dependent Clp protease ATP-binding subunit ClpA
MFQRIAGDARRVVLAAAEEEAAVRSSPTIEAEHLLLALAAAPGLPASALLAGEGLDHDGVLAALERETERSLAAVGVAAEAFALQGPPPAPRRRPRFAASGRLALERAVRTTAARGDRRVTAEHLLVGVLRADLGTVPRALEVAGVDRVALATRAERLLDG